MGAYDDAIAYGQRAQALAVAGGDTGEQAVASSLLGTVCFSLGDYHRATDVLRRALTSLTGERLSKRFGAIMASARAHAWLMDCLAELGEFAEGRAYGTAAARIAQETADPSGAILSQSRLGHLVLQQGEFDRAIAIREPTYTHCCTADILLYLSVIMVGLGVACALSGRVPEALHLIEQVVVHNETRGGGIPMMIRLGEASLVAGRPEHASHLAARALVLSRDRKECGNQAWALRLLGEIALLGNPLGVTQAAPHYSQALTLAKERSMRPLQAHCHRGLGTLYATSGQREQARTALSTAIEMYRGMEMTFWLPETEAALAQVDAR